MKNCVEKATKNYVDNKIKSIGYITRTSIPDFLKSDDVSLEGYEQMRHVLNVELVEALTGGEIFMNPDGDAAIKFNHRLPNKDQMCTVLQTLDEFIKKYENPYLISVSGTVAEADDMSIPASVSDVFGNIDKFTNKVLKECLTASGSNSILWGDSNIHISVADCLSIISAATEARKRATRNTVLIVGTLLLAAVGAGVAAGIVMNKMKNDEDADVCPGCEDIDTDIVDVDLDDPTPTVDLDDPVPTVDLDADNSAVDLG